MVLMLTLFLMLLFKLDHVLDVPLVHFVQGPVLQVFELKVQWLDS